MEPKMSRKDRIKEYIKTHKVEIGYIAIVATTAIVAITQVHKYYQDIENGIYDEDADFEAALWMAKYLDEGVDVKSALLAIKDDEIIDYKEI